MMVRRVLACYTDQRVTVQLSSTTPPPTRRGARATAYELEISHAGDDFTNARGWPESGRVEAWEAFRAVALAELNDRVAVVRMEGTD